MHSTLEEKRVAQYLSNATLRVDTHAAPTHQRHVPQCPPSLASRENDILLDFKGMIQEYVRAGPYLPLFDVILSPTQSLQIVVSMRCALKAHIKQY